MTWSVFDPTIRVDDKCSCYEIDSASLADVTHAAVRNTAIPHGCSNRFGAAMFRPTASFSVPPNEVWRTGFGPDLVKLSSARLESLSGPALLRLIDYLRTNRLDAAAYELALWNKVVYPLATGVMIVLAVPLVLTLGGTGIGQRFFMAV